MNGNSFKVMNLMNHYVAGNNRGTQSPKNQLAFGIERLLSKDSDRMSPTSVPSTPYYCHFNDASLNFSVPPVSPTFVGTKPNKTNFTRQVFDDAQRKGLENRFQIKKYIAKPDRERLAQSLGLTDLQVKVWFQNRRVKWRLSKEYKDEISKSDE